MTIAIKRLTADADRTVSFGLFYAMMNVAALLSGLAIDALRLGLPNGIVGAGDALASPTRVVLLSTVVTSALALVVAWRFRDVPAGDAGDAGGGGGGGGAYERFDDDDDDEFGGFFRRARAAGVFAAVLAAASKAKRAFDRSIRAPTSSLLRTPRFYQFLAMAMFTLNLKQIFRHMDATFPKFAVRAFGCDAPFGSIYAINPALIIVGVPLVSSVTATARHFDMIFRGSWITSLSPFILAAWQSIPGAVLFVVTLSIGEMMWSPRWYDYTMAMAPAGKEGVFGALGAYSFPHTGPSPYIRLRSRVERTRFLT
jgi:proton-dependent oligopeptide transporter, POT family